MKNLVILTGGVTPERVVALKSAKNIASLIKNYNVFFVEILENRDWIYDGQFCELVRKDGKIFLSQGAKLVEIELVFPVMHTDAENGDMAGYLHWLGAKFVGNSIASSVVTFDKIFTKQIARDLKIGVLDFIIYNNHTYEDCAKKFGNKLFVKPAASGSSLGCSQVFDAAQFSRAIQEAQKFSKNVLVEPLVRMREITFGIIKDEVAEPVIIQVQESGFFDFSSKTAPMEVKFDVETVLAERLKLAGKKLFDHFGLQYARMDFFVDSNDFIFFNETNSIPGLGSSSLFISSFGKKFTPVQVVEKMLENCVIRP
jgi:D-alanine-D-alanine ligase